MAPVYNGQKYHYSSYWRTWSRILSIEKGWVTEVDLLPVNPQDMENWEQTAKVHIRRHCIVGVNDKLTNSLPHDVLNSMFNNLGHAKAGELLTTDFLSQIDWDKYNIVCNGGAVLEDCKLEGR